MNRACSRCKFKNVCVQRVGKLTEYYEYRVLHARDVSYTELERVPLFRRVARSLNYAGAVGRRAGEM